MRTISIHECVTPVSLRTCGSSSGSLLQKRRQLKSPEKAISRITPTLDRIPHLCGVSISPHKQVGLDDAEVGRQQFDSPMPHWQYEGYCSASPSVSSDEFSDEDIAELCYGAVDSSARDTPDNLFVVGSKQRLSCKYETPKPLSQCDFKAKESFVNQQSDIHVDDDRKSAALGMERDSTSPENPPPSPVNFRPSMDGFVVGGRRLSRPENSKSTIALDYNCRDFNPGFVKHPLYHCGKCEEKVVVEEKSQNALQRRHSTFVNSRASPYRHNDGRLGVTTSLTTPSGMYVCRPGYYDNAQSSSDDYIRTFVEVYTEKRRNKEEMDRQKVKEKENRKKEGAIRMLERSKRVEDKRSEIIASKSTKERSAILAELARECIQWVGGTNQRHETPTTPADDTVITPKDARDSMPGSDEISDAQTRTLGRVGDLSVARTVQGDDQTTKLPRLPATLYSQSSCTVVEKCQVRRCWSDIWPFPDENAADVTAQDGADAALSNTISPARNTSRITPFCPMPFKQLSSKSLTSKSLESVTSLKEKHVTSCTDVNAAPIELKDEEGESTAAGQTTQDGDVEESTMTATVIVPPAERACTQWISFNTDQEPVLNNSPPVDDNCDTFLKRLQRTKIQTNSDAGVATGNQFCFEAMVDKRYNRWKRRRRKRKEAEYHRSTAPPSSDSSGEEDERERRVAMERIIDHMYAEIHGAAPETPNGSRDTPRVRNRRRRREHTWDGADGHAPHTEQGSTAVHYDASSEWTSSEKEAAQISSNSSVGIGSISVDPSSSDTRLPELVPDDRQRTTTRAESPRMERCTDALIAIEDVDIVETGAGRDKDRGESESDAERDSSPTAQVDLGGWPFMEQYKAEIMKRIQASSPEQDDDVRTRDWLPKLPSRPSSREGEPGCRSDSGSDNVYGQRSPSPLCNDKDIQIVSRRRTGSDSHLISNHVMPSPAHKPGTSIGVDAAQDSRMYQKWSRKRTAGFGTTSKQREDVTRATPMSRNNASTWSEMGIHPKPLNPPKPIGVVTVGGTSTSPVRRAPPTTFKAALRPIRSTDSPTSMDKPRKSTAPRQNKKSDVSLPLVMKNAKKQTVPGPRQRRHRVTAADNTLFGQTTAERGQSKKGKTHSSTAVPSYRGKHVAFGKQSAPELAIRNFYLRSLYGNKTRMNSHINSNNQTGLRASITVGKLDIGSRKPAKQPMKSSKPTGISITRAFTYSMFDLPEVYRLYNQSLLLRARGEVGVESDE